MLTKAERDKKQEWNRRWYERNRERRLLQMRRYTWAWSLRRRYGLSPEDYAVLLKAQGGRCALCLQEKLLVVDHDHAVGAGKREAVRGQLCNRCNCETFRLVERRMENGEDFWTLVREYRPLGLTPDKATYLAAYLRIPAAE